MIAGGCLILILDVEIFYYALSVISIYKVHSSYFTGELGRKFN